MEQHQTGLNQPSPRGRDYGSSRASASYVRRYVDEFSSRGQAEVADLSLPPKPVYMTAKPSVAQPAPQAPTRRTNHQPGLPKQTRSNVLKRQMVKSSTKKYRAKRPKRHLMPTLLSSMAIVLFLAGLVMVFSSLRTNRSVKAQVKQLSGQTDSNDGGITDGIPTETDPPTNLSSYTVAQDEPRIFSIDKLGVNARVKRLGVGPDNVLKAPSSIFDVGWYDASAKPGENGTVVLDGHVSGPTKHGVFYNINSLKAGDKVQLERGDGKTFTYTVTGSQVYDYDKVDMVKVMTSSVPGKPALNFMTCTGRFNVRTNKFEQRVVVFTVQDS